MQRIGYIGLGIMGRPMARNLLKAGFQLTVWNRTAEKSAELAEAGATVVESPAEVARAVEAVCINVTDTPDVEQVIFGRRGILESNSGESADLLVIDHSTISPSATRQFAERLAERRIAMLDAPVSGGDIGAQRGQLSIMVGGDEAVFERCRPTLEVNAGQLTHVGPIGSGQLTKAANQVLCAVHMMALCEAMMLARAQGLDLSAMLQVTGAGAGGSWALSNLGPKIAAGDIEPGFMIDLILKDLEIVRDEARQCGLPMPGLDLAAAMFRAAAKQGLGRKGTHALCRVYEELAGIRFAPSP